MNQDTLQPRNQYMAIKNLQRSDLVANISLTKNKKGVGDAVFHLNRDTQFPLSSLPSCVWKRTFGHNWQRFFYVNQPCQTNEGKLEALIPTDWPGLKLSSSRLRTTPKIAPFTLVPVMFYRRTTKMHWLTQDHWRGIQTLCQSQDCVQQVQQQPSCLHCLEPGDRAPLQHLCTSWIFSSGVDFKFDSRLFMTYRLNMYETKRYLDIELFSPWLRRS